jgi:hypothetical protein
MEEKINFVGRLMEYAQAKKLSLPVFNIFISGGTANQPLFTGNCKWNGKMYDPDHMDDMHSKQEVKQNLASIILKQLITAEWSLGGFTEDFTSTDQSIVLPSGGAGPCSTTVANISKDSVVFTSSVHHIGPVLPLLLCDTHNSNNWSYQVMRHLGECEIQVFERAYSGKWTHAPGIAVHHMYIPAEIIDSTNFSAMYMASFVGQNLARIVQTKKIIVYGNAFAAQFLTTTLTPLGVVVESNY